ncbi:cellulose biosynthesis protein BcsO [Yersinia bercovieri]|uniref:cellulose biosynthesis protein BcsO n=1 Tax=Yersinia bercovieri TaxID=634 RepID=UPI0011A8F3C8|nr:cellulose biosynthesis protein BcsO [Yersinia bercovieri]
MNKYDDIKQFKDKIDMQDINYKEISEGEAKKSGSTWALIKQMSSQESNSLLENGRTTQPTPQPISAAEFAEPDALKKMSGTRQINSDFLQNPRTVARPAIIESLFPAPPTPTTPAPESHSEHSTVTSPLAELKPTTQILSSSFDKLDSGNNTEFKHIFSPKGPQSHQVIFTKSSRDIPLQSLLESIALCR